MGSEMCIRDRYRTDSCCDGSGGESETDLLSAGSSCSRNSDRVRDWNCRRKDFTGCEERSCKDSIDNNTF